MIFDNDYVTRLVQAWQLDENPETLAEIMAASTSLIEVIVSGFDSGHREDLIQEASLKVIRSLEVYDAEVASLHTYLTTVIRNACISWMEKHNNPSTDVELEDVDILGHPDIDDEPLKDLLTDLITYNRKRFPSLPVDALDEVTEALFTKFKYGTIRAKAITLLADSLGYSRSIIAIIATSSIIYLRSRYISSAKAKELDDEFTLLPELRLVLGEAAYKRFITVFSGFSVRVP